MKRVMVLTSVAMIVTFVLAISFPPAFAAKKAELRLITFIVNKPPGKARIDMFLDIMNKKSQGEYEVKLIGGPEAMAPPDVPGAVQKGVFEMGDSLNALIGQIVPGLTALNLSAATIKEERTNGATEYLQSLFNKAGLYYLGHGSPIRPQSFLYIFSNKPINSLEDFKKLKIGNASPMFMPLWKALGSEQVVMPLGDFYIGMQHGAIDAYVHSITEVAATGLYEVSKYMLDCPLNSGTNSFYLNLKAWNKLSETARNHLNEAILEFEDQYPPFYEKSMREPSIKLCTEKGVKVIKFPAADEKKLRGMYQELLWNAEIKKNPETASKLAEFLKK